MTKILRWAAALMACAALLACGGGGDSGVKGQAPLGDSQNPVTNAFSGTFGGQDAAGFVLDDGSFWLLYGGPAPYGSAMSPAGLIYGSAGSGPGLGGVDGQAKFRAFEYTGNGVPPATDTTELSFGGPLSASAIGGYFARYVEQWPNSQFSGDFTLYAMTPPNYAFQQSTNISNIPSFMGTWLGYATGSVPSSITIGGDGTVSGSAFDCSLSGQTSYNQTNYLSFVADLTCATGVRQVHGVIFTYQSNSGAANLFLAATASDQSAAFGFMGSR